MKKSILLLAFLVSIFSIQSQEFYICTFELNPINQSIYLVDQNFDLTFITDVENSAGNLLDIALSEDGTMYGITEGSVLIEINLTDGSTSNLHFFNSGLEFTSLVYDSVNNALWTLERSTFTLFRIV